MHELSITRLVAAPPSVLFRTWTEPELMQQWFTPRPWTTPVVRTDPRPGGSSHIVMRGPAGEEHTCLGVYLEVVKDRKIVLTDAYTDAWTPAAKPFMTTIVTFEAENGGTRYTARALHWTAEDRQAHLDMGFEAGWNAAADQLEALCKSLL